MRLPPGPPPVKGIVNQLRLFNAIKRQHARLLGAACSTSTAISITMEFGTSACIMVSNPEAIYEILVTKTPSSTKARIIATASADWRAFSATACSPATASSGSASASWSRRRCTPSASKPMPRRWSMTTLRMIDGWRDQAELDVDQEMMRATMLDRRQVAVQRRYRRRGRRARRRGADRASARDGRHDLLPAWVPTPGKMRTNRAVARPGRRSSTASSPSAADRRGLRRSALDAAAGARRRRQRHERPSGARRSRDAVPRRSRDDRQRAQLDVAAAGAEPRRRSQAARGTRRACWAVARRRSPT